MKTGITLITFIMLNIMILIGCAIKASGVNGESLNKKLTFFQKDEIRHIRDIDDDINETPSDSNLVTSDMMSCSDDGLMNILADADIISPESFIQMALSDQHTSCKIIASHIAILKTYFRHCGMSINDIGTTTRTIENSGGNAGSLSGRDLYTSLIRGIYALNEKLCMDQSFITRLEEYSDCIRPVVDDFDACAGPADWNEESDPEKLCKTYADVVRCYYVRSAKVCGLEAANIIRELIVHVFDNILKPIATEYCASQVNALTSVDDAMPKDIALGNVDRSGYIARSHSTFSQHDLSSSTSLIFTIITILIVAQIIS